MRSAAAIANAVHTISTRRSGNTNSKKTGNAGELELLHLLERHSLLAHRNDQRYVGGVDNPDIALTLAGQPIHLEVKQCERLSLYEAMEQAERNANGHALSVVVHRRSRKPWLVVLRLEDVLRKGGMHHDSQGQQRPVVRRVH